MIEKNKKIAEALKELRLEKKLSVDEVIDLLNNRGFDIKAKTLYAYEGGNSMPNADIFLTLCDIYQVNNILKRFGYGDTIVPDVSGAVLLSIPLISDICEYGKIKDLDVSPLLRFLSDDSSRGALNHLLAGKGLTLPVINEIEKVCKASLETIFNVLGRKPEDYLPYTFSREEINAALAYRAVSKKDTFNTPLSESTNPAV